MPVQEARALGAKEEVQTFHSKLTPGSVGARTGPRTLSPGLGGPLVLGAGDETPWPGGELSLGRKAEPFTPVFMEGPLGRR